MKAVVNQRPLNLQHGSKDNVQVFKNYRFEWAKSHASRFLERYIQDQEDFTYRELDTIDKFYQNTIKKLKNKRTQTLPVRTLQLVKSKGRVVRKYRESFFKRLHLQLGGDGNLNQAVKFFVNEQVNYKQFKPNYDYLDGSIDQHLKLDLMKNLPS